MIEKHGTDTNQHLLGDVDCWRDSTGEGRELYGIGSSDPYFVVTGTPYTSSTSGLTQAALQQSQEEFRQQMREEMQQQVDEMRRNMREEMQQQMREEMQQQMREEMRQQMASFFKQFSNNSGNHPP